MDNVFEDRCEKLFKGDDLPPGVIRMVGLHCQRKLSVGDKMAGRHGNKGVVSTVQPIENMHIWKMEPQWISYSTHLGCHLE